MVKKFLKRDDNNWFLNTGESEAVCPTGPIGPDGNRGPAGIAGNTGPTGPIGDTGPAGSGAALLIMLV